MQWVDPHIPTKNSALRNTCGIADYHAIAMGRGVYTHHPDAAYRLPFFLLSHKCQRSMPMPAKEAHLPIAISISKYHSSWLHYRLSQLYTAQMPSANRIRGANADRVNGKICYKREIAYPTSTHIGLLFSHPNHSLPLYLDRVLRHP